MGEGTYLPDPQPTGPARCDTQAHAHRAAVLGADLLDACDSPGGAELRHLALRMRTAFRDEFWIDDLGGGRPAAARTTDGRLVPHLGAGAAHLLDTGLLGDGTMAPGLLDKVRTEQLARLLTDPALDSGWGLRGLGAKEPGHNPFGHRSGAVRVHETAVAVAGLATAGHEKEAGLLLRGVLSAAGHFGHRLPEMYGGERRTDGAGPLPHPAACRPAATAAAAGVLMLTSLAGIRPRRPPPAPSPSAPCAAHPSARSASPASESPAPPSPYGSAASDSPWSKKRPKNCNCAPDLAVHHHRQAPPARRGPHARAKRISQGSGRRRECLSSGRRL
ncbi:hypothetical protein GCM10020256_17690 [Streptomyces thermocoprophilus]